MTSEPSDEVTYWACVGFRHDFGLLTESESSTIRDDGLTWLDAWRSAYSPAAGGPVGLGNGWTEPNAHIVDAACLQFDPGFRTRRFHDASATRRDGIEWLQAWRKAFDVDVQPSAPNDHPQRPVIFEADADPDPRVAALIRCAAAGVPTDVQALLIQGDPMRGIPRDIVGIILQGSTPAAINWRDDPTAIVEDDEPQVGRDYA